MLLTACKVEVISRHRPFFLEKDYCKHVFHIAQWITGKWPASFGLFLCGNRGNGKTTMVRALQSLVFLLRSKVLETPDDRYLPYHTGFEMITAKDLVLLAKAYTNPTRDNQREKQRYLELRDIEVLAIDDLGVEPAESINYGDFVTAAQDILAYRYDRQFTTIATSNLAPSEIKDYYDERLADRFREMMTIIDFGNENSFRGAQT